MKRIILFLGIMLYAISMYAQNSGKQKAYTSEELRRFKELKKKSDLVFNDNDPDFKVTDVPDAWKKESAVVLCQKYYFNYDYSAASVMGGKHISTNELVRRRVKLFDRAAIEAFSEFFYRNSKSAAFRVIKPDGSTNDVDPKNAVDVVAGNSVPRFYKSLNLNAAYKKIAIPDLEAGDIIDYFYQSSDVILLEGLNQYNYSPVIFTLAGNYPVLKQKYEFIVDKNFFINFKSFNGAPELKQAETAVISDDKVSKKAKAYVLEDINREKSAEERWSNEYLSDPMIKFQVYYTGDPESCFEFVGKSTEVRSEIVSGNEVRDLVMQYVKKYAVKTWHSEEIHDWIIKENNPAASAIEKALLCYYYLRYSYGYKEHNNFTQTFTEKAGPGSWEFITTMVEVVRELDLIDQTEIVAMVPGNIGSINTLLLSAELELGIRVGGEKGVILFPFEKHTTHDYVKPVNLGLEAWCFSAEIKKVAGPVQRIIIPASSFESNEMIADFNISLSEDMELLQVKRTSYYSGLQKYPYFKLALMSSDYVTDDEKKYIPDYNEIPRSIAKRDIPEYRKEKEKKHDQQVKNQKEEFKKVMESDFEVESYDNFRLLKKGRDKGDSILSYEEQFKIKGMINKAGRNYSLDVGKLIGSQIKINDDELIRNHDIYYSFPKKLVNNISINLPQGYVPDNMQDLEVNVDNEAGSFSSVASFESGTLTITTTKIYKTSFSSKDKWPLWVSFLESAYNYSQKKLILKKS